MSNVVRCRAKITEDCSDGYGQTESQWEEAPWYEDGTYQGDDDTGTIVCDACYVELGCPPLEHLDAAIAARKDTDHAQ